MGEILTFCLIFFQLFPPALCCDTSEKVHIGWNPRITLHQLLNSHFKATIMISISVMSTTTMSAKAWRVLSFLRMTAAAENYKYKNAFYTFLNSKYNSWWVKNVLIILAVRDELISTWIIQKSNCFILFYLFFFFQITTFWLMPWRKIRNTYQCSIHLSNQCWS